MTETIEVNKKALVDVHRRLKEALEYWNQPYGDPTQPTVEDAADLLQQIYREDADPVDCIHDRCDNRFTSASELWSHMHSNHNWAANKKDRVEKHFISKQLKDE